MANGLILLASKIKTLRNQLGISQAELARKLGLTRSCVNGWEMGLSVPSTQYIVELAQLFHVSTDYLLGLDRGTVLNVDGLKNKEVAVLVDIIECFHTNRTLERP